MLLAVLRLVQVASFKDALPSQQAEPLAAQLPLGAIASGATLAFAVIMLVPNQAYLLQALVYGLIAAAVLSACVAYAVSLRAFPGLRPALMPSILPTCSTAKASCCAAGAYSA